MSNFDIPVMPEGRGKYIPSEEDKEYIKSFAIDGVIPFEDYVRAVNEVLNKSRIYGSDLEEVSV